MTINETLQLVPLQTKEYPTYLETIDEKVFTGWSHMWNRQGEQKDFLKWMNFITDHKKAIIFGVNVNNEKAGIRALYTDFNEVNLQTGGWLSEEYRGKGIGKKVLNEVIQYTPYYSKIKTIITATQETNIAARKNLESCGFKQTGFHYSNTITMVDYRLKTG